MGTAEKNYLDEETRGTNLGERIALSADSLTLALGARLNNFCSIRVFHFVLPATAPSVHPISVPRSYPIVIPSHQ